MNIKSFLMALVLIVVPINAAVADVNTNIAVDMFLRTVISEAQYYIKTESLTEKEKMRGLDRIFTQSFDLPKIGKFILGRNWRKATFNQRQAFIKAFSAMTVYKYVPILAKVPVNKFTVKRIQPLSKVGTMMVYSTVSRENGNDINVVWRIVSYADGIYRILDVQIEGMSFLITLRAEYASFIQREGGIDNLISALWARVEKLATENAKK